MPSTPRAVPGQSLGVRTLRCGLYEVLLYLRFVFWPRQPGFWRWRPLWAGDRGAASCGASVPTQPPSAMNGSLRLPARGLPAAGRVAEVSPRAFARCGRPGPVGRFQGFRRLFGLAGRSVPPGRPGPGVGVKKINVRPYSPPAKLKTGHATLPTAILGSHGCKKYKLALDRERGTSWHMQ